MYTKEYTLLKASEQLGFTRTEITQGSSLLLNCSFYETKFKNIYITDYDLRNDNDLEKKGLSMLFYKDRAFLGARISNELFEYVQEFDRILEYFKLKCEAFIKLEAK